MDYELGRRLDRLDANQRRLENKMAQLLERFGIAQEEAQRSEEEMSAELDKLADKVSKNTDAVNSASTLLSTLAQELRDLPADKDAINALADKMDANNAAWAKAVIDNTPADPTTPPAPAGQTHTKKAGS